MLLWWHGQPQELLRRLSNDPTSCLASASVIHREDGTITVDLIKGDGRTPDFQRFAKSTIEHTMGCVDTDRLVKTTIESFLDFAGF